MCVCLDLLFIYGFDVSISQIPEKEKSFRLKITLCNIMFV